jgi:hypothetical protein
MAKPYRKNGTKSIEKIVEDLELEAKINAWVI